MDISLTKEDIKYLSCALSLYMEKTHVEVKFSNDDYVYIPDRIFDRHIDCLYNLHNLQNRLLELLNND